MTREGILFLSFRISEGSSLAGYGVRYGSNCVFAQVLNPTPFMKKFLLQGSDWRGHLTGVYIFVCALFSSWTFCSDLMKSESTQQAPTP